MSLQNVFSVTIKSPLKWRFTGSLAALAIFGLVQLALLLLKTSADLTAIVFLGGWLAWMIVSLAPHPTQGRKRL